MPIQTPPLLTQGQPVTTEMVAIDPKLSNQIALAEGLPTEIAPNINASWTAVALGHGHVRYYTSNTCTGSAQGLNFALPKPHRLKRAEFQLVDSDTGEADTTGLAVALKRFNIVQSAAKSNGTLTDLMDQANVTNDTVIFVFGDGWECANGQYQVVWTGETGASICIDLYVEYW